MKKLQLKKYYYSGLIYLCHRLLELLNRLTVIVGGIWETSVFQYYSLSHLSDQPPSPQPETSDSANSPQDFERHIEWKKAEPSKSTTTSASSQKRSRAKPAGGTTIRKRPVRRKRTNPVSKPRGKRSNKKRGE